MNLSLAKRAELALPKGFLVGISNPFEALKAQEGDCIAGALVIRALASEEDGLLGLFRYSRRVDTRDYLDDTHFFCPLTPPYILHVGGGEDSFKEDIRNI